MKTNGFQNKKIIVRLIALLLVVAVVVGAVFGVRIWRSKSTAVPVYELSTMTTDSMDMGMTDSELYGTVSSDQVQTIYVSDTETVTEVYVKEGQSVKKGDALLAYDTTLTDLELTRKELDIQKAKLELADLKSQAGIKSSSSTTGTTSSTSTSGTTTTDTTTTDSSGPPEEESSALEAQSSSVVNTDGSKTDETSGDSGSSSGSESSDSGNTSGGGNSDSGNTSGSGSSGAGSQIATTPDTKANDNSTATQKSSSSAKKSSSSSSKKKTTTGSSSSTYKSGGSSGTTSYSDDSSSSTSLSSSEVSDIKSEIKEKELEIKMDENELSKMKKEMDDGKVLAKVDGVVASVQDADTARTDGTPIVKITGEGGFKITSSIDEYNRDTLTEGEEVTVTSYESGNSYTGTVASIGDAPTDSQDISGTGSSNVSYYPFTVTVSSDADFSDNEYVSVKRASENVVNGEGFYLEDMYILSEGSKRYVYVRGDNDKLEKRQIKTGTVSYGSTQVISGLDPSTDWIAFPYGNNIKEGARTVESTTDELYSAE